jgi:hypothetical protein
LYLVALLIAAAASTPRRVGDGGEYFVMALQLASGRPPSLSAEDLARVKQQLATLQGGFESSLLDYPDLVSSDGRQDFLHFFLYPLTVAPAVALVNAAGLNPNWAFTLVNAVLLAAAFFVVARHASLAAAIAGFVGPVIWWVDKAHTEAFLFAMVSIAAVVFWQRPALALITFALAGAQNAALGITYPLFAAMLWYATRHTTFTTRTWIAGVSGAAIAASPFIYTFVRLGRWSPMAEYAQRIVPSPAAVAAFVIEPNIGLLPHAPVYGLALICAVWLLIRAMRTDSRLPSLWWWPIVIQGVLLAAWSQNPNANHGGTPSLNRWVLSLLALSLPWLALARERLPSSSRVLLNVLVAVSAVMSAAAHLPSRPENYREPAVLAQRMWRRGLVHVTPAEVFAERAQGREPAFAPGHDGTCSVMLIADQQAPAQCPPPAAPLPAWCRGTGAMCYAVVDNGSAHYVPAPVNGFFYRAAPQSWPAGGPLAAAMSRVMREASPSTRAWQVDNSRRWREIFADAALGTVLTSPEATVVYVLRASDRTLRMIDDQGWTVTPLVGESPTDNLAVIIRK